MIVKTFEELKIHAAMANEILAEVSISNVTVYVNVDKEAFLKSINGFTGAIQGDASKLPMYRKDFDCLYLWEKD